MHLNFEAILPSLPFILEGLVVTLQFTLIAIACGLPLGALLSFCKIGRSCALRYFADGYTAVFRGTPLLVQLGLIYYGIPQITGYKITAFEAGIITFSLNSAAYTSEIIRTGIQSIDRGQWDAGYVLGLSYSTVLFRIIMPQAVRNILPALVNEMVDLLKESALVATIGEMDLFRRAQIVGAEHFIYFEPVLCVAVIYFLMVMVISKGAKLLERKLNYA